MNFYKVYICVITSEITIQNIASTQKPYSCFFPNTDATKQKHLPSDLYDRRSLPQFFDLIKIKSVSVGVGKILPTLVDLPSITLSS